MIDPFRILFVCTGNSCRSPMAEAILRKRIEEKSLKSVESLSAGTFALDGHPASSEAVVAVQKFGASLDGFHAQIFGEELAEDAHMILVMEKAHYDFFEEYYPTQIDKVRLLGQYLYPKGPEEIPDPVGGPQELFDAVARLIDEAIGHLMNEWDRVVERYYYPRKKVVSVAFDHRSFPYKEWLIQILESMGNRVIDCGTMTPERCDHPDFAFKAAEEVYWKRADRSVMICSTGHGMLLSANKVPGIRCVMPLNEVHSILSRQHNNANALAFGTDYHSQDLIERIVRVWMDTEFLGGRYQHRIRKIMNYELPNLR